MTELQQFPLDLTVDINVGAGHPWYDMLIKDISAPGVNRAYVTMTVHGVTQAFMLTDADQNWNSPAERPMLRTSWRAAPYYAPDNGVLQ
jgi:hypothetical protein